MALSAVGLVVWTFSPGFDTTPAHGAVSRPGEDDHFVLAKDPSAEVRTGRRLPKRQRADSMPPGARRPA